LIPISAVRRDLRFINCQFWRTAANHPWSGDFGNEEKRARDQAQSLCSHSRGRSRTEAVSYKEPDDAYLVLLDRSGQIVAQRPGSFSATGYRQFEREILALLNGK